MERQRAHSFFVTPAWARILEAAGLGLTCTALLATEGAQEVLLPVARKRDRFGFVSLRSMPWGTYGGPLASGASDNFVEAAGAIVSHVRRTLGLGWFVATPGPWPHVPLGRQIATYSTQILQLGAGVGELWKGLDKGTRNQVRQAERAGVQVVVDSTQAGFDEYYAMLQASAERWGRRDPGKPRSLFDAIRALTGDGRARLWLGRHGSRTAAGALCFYGKSEVFYWSGAMYSELARSRANNLIQWRVIQDAAARGFETYNMGSSGDLEGVRHFKAGFGPKPHEYPAYFAGTGPFRLAPAALKLRRAGRR